MLMVFSLAACGSDGNSPAEEVSSTETQEAMSETSGTENSEQAGTSSDTSQDDEGSLEALGGVEVDQGLFNVTLAIPEYYAKDITDEDLENAVNEKGFKEAKRNDDGSITYVMTKAQHKELMDDFCDKLDQSLDEMIGSDDYPNITKIEHNDNYTDFTITTKSTELGFSESVAALGFYMYGGLYNIYNGTPVDNVHVDFVNADTGETISSADSKDAGTGSSE